MIRLSGVMMEPKTLMTCKGPDGDLVDLDPGEPEAGVGDIRLGASTTAGGVWWKLAVAERLHEPGRRMVWTDDDLAADPPAQEWVDRHPEVLGVSPETSVGLTPQDLDRIEAFLRG